MDKVELYRQVYTAFKRMCAEGRQPSSFCAYCKKHVVDQSQMPLVLKEEFRPVRTLPGYVIDRGMALACLIWAIAVSVAAMIIPPAGVIDSSVLVLIAQIFVLIATLLGIKDFQNSRNNPPSKQTTPSLQGGFCPPGNGGDAKRRGCKDH